ncbi:hypothetical protein LK07_29295 [Streptomyces pluripotens]|uniref:Uncharacterized protein n=1 Tax=Streptomyces pluripotens TaxID=1355015 RepID=A0A221P5I9_9ACTN|nr:MULTISPECIES: hypothetical protein [Streptomyces]ARP73201.1 hypothetical protein LK06_028125 [Streptomyces pluripotens]ASN27450.1 hypothetical protein LK07_29295 [Streptomyces pluripotens]KIE23196.1 hypothetical protein LK08_31275 [Streptomyces sp. MUSC 125]MCH0558020.1 hypothetical protein [Streptomyces sp. MUM 16J]
MQPLWAEDAARQTPEQTQARQVIKDCERRLARSQAAPQAGAEPIVATQRGKDAAQKKLDAR